MHVLNEWFYSCTYVIEVAVKINVTEFKINPSWNYLN